MNVYDYNKDNDYVASWHDHDLDCAGCEGVLYPQWCVQCSEGIVHSDEGDFGTCDSCGEEYE